MTKTLTEQWRDGEIFGFHYVKVPEEEPEIHNVSCMDYLLDEYGVEVLARVPSYDKWKQMIDGNKATIRHLKKILPMIEYNKVAYDYLKQVIEDMEKEMEGVTIMSGTGKINDFVPIGTSLVGEVTFHGKVTGKDNKDEQIERLQEQLKEANEIISIYRIYDDTECGKATEYCKKWGVK